ncbi:MAG: type IV pilin protein [Planctomycetota bacterium]|jgi:prepilin-type N-terminal cleavage/methylation domain-containing protein
MKSKKGFTLIELMVVILIVAILAAVAIPILRGRIDAAKWSEGKAMMGSIATAIRAQCAEYDPTATPTYPTTLLQLGFITGDLDGTYFTEDCFGYTINDHSPADFSVTCDATASLQDAAPSAPQTMSLSDDGTGAVWGS